MARMVLSEGTDLTKPMLEGIYNNAANLSALEKWQETVSRNLAASQTAGFKRTQFSILAEDGVQVGQGKDNLGVNSAALPKGASAVDFSAGTLQPTGKPTDFAVGGDGFFQIQGPSGQSLYTRNGEFHINNQNTLVNHNGMALVGEGGPVVVDPQKGAITVGADGTISQGENQLGKIPLYSFANGSTDLTQVSGGFIPKKGITPQVVEKPQVLQGVIESSNVSAISEMVSLIMVSNAYQASQKLITSHDQLMGQAIQTLGAPPVG